MPKTEEEIRLECVNLAYAITNNEDLGKVLEAAEIINQFVMRSEPTNTVLPTKKIVPKQTTEAQKAVETVKKSKAEKLHDDDLPPGADPTIDQERRDTIENLIDELSMTDRIVMRKLLEKVETKHLEAAYTQYLPRVIGK